MTPSSPSADSPATAAPATPPPPSAPPRARFPFYVRLLHLLFVAGVAAQLFTSEFMKMPRPGRTLTDWQQANLSVHDKVGTVLLMLMVGFVVARVLRAGARGQLWFFPWASPAGRQALRREVQGLLQLAPRAAERMFQVARAVQGLGVMLIMCLGTTGLLLDQAIEAGGRLSPVMRVVKEVHELAGNGLWVYLGAHVGLLVPALLARRWAILDMFRFGRATRPSAAASAGPKS